jgi:DNA modification methylase
MARSNQRRDPIAQATVDLSRGPNSSSPLSQPVLGVTSPSFASWTGGRVVSSIGTNSGAAEIPFQRWRHFKEAFAPELVARAVAASPGAITRCVDPFSGSGTTALACQFLNVAPIAIEVNPFLADLTEAKLATYDSGLLARDLEVLFSRMERMSMEPETILRNAPATFLEPGVNGRWIFDRAIAVRIASVLAAIETLNNRNHRRLFRVLLGGILIPVSNVVVNGKGRRYRGGWRTQQRHPSAVDELFFQACQSAIVDVHRFGRRACMQYSVHRGDCRRALARLDPVDLAVFSPPYPNSFDYTDVYNVELWTLGYLAGSEANRHLRLSTLCSHVQISRSFPDPPTGSRRLDGVLTRLDQKRSTIWDRRIPSMVGGYFADLVTVLTQLRKAMTARGEAWIVLGDSRYAGIRIDTAGILEELAAQQGGHHNLKESLLVLTRG